MAELTQIAAEHLSQGIEGSEAFVQNVGQWNDSIDTANLNGLLPLAIAFLILHEMYFSTSENRPPRIWWMLLRIAGFGACLVSYGRIVSLLTGLVGGGSWPDSGNLIAPLDFALDAQITNLSNVGWGNMAEFSIQAIVWAALFFIDCFMALIALLIVTVIVKGQALALLIFITAGKTCLILSIMPGVGIAKSWAKAVATVAAWSFMAKIVYSAVGALSPSLGHYAASTSVAAHMQIWLAYGLLAVFTLLIPKLVSALVSGGMSVVPGMGVALAGGMFAARFLRPKLPPAGRIRSKNKKSKASSEKGQKRQGKVSRGQEGQSTNQGKNKGVSSNTPKGRKVSRNKEAKSFWPAKFQRKSSASKTVKVKAQRPRSKSRERN